VDRERDPVERFARDAVDRAPDLAREAVERVPDFARDVVERVPDFARDVVERLPDVARDAVDRERALAPLRPAALRFAAVRRRVLAAFLAAVRRLPPPVTRPSSSLTRDLRSSIAEAAAVLAVAPPPSARSRASASDRAARLRSPRARSVSNKSSVAFLAIRMSSFRHLSCRVPGTGTTVTPGRRATYRAVRVPSSHSPAGGCFHGREGRACSPRARGAPADAGAARANASRRFG
jgi:hypothetical protein